jgi:hypothetical protein
MIAEIILIWAGSIYGSMFFAGRKDLNITKAFFYSLVFNVFALIFYMIYVPEDYFAKYRHEWGGLGFLMLIFFGAIALFWIAVFYVTHPGIL